MIVSAVAKKMVEFSEGNLHDINHLLKVHAYAKIIGECEGLLDEVQTSLELAALLHDIACPLCRIKYGNTNAKCQQEEGAILAKGLLSGFGLPDSLIDRVVYLVGHHHTLEAIKGLDYQILIEADYLVNADEGKLPEDHIRHMMETVFKTKTGIALLKSVYRL
ncbi:MAG: HD domain-containing protein [Firmicutes bacterium]|nr:HD domain-containing protein [Bacillota bacterium]